MIYDLIVVGGGAAGFYGAIQCAELSGGASILIVEKSPKLLSKVRISGGGRCNVTHSCFEARPLSKHYPRGEKFLSQVFRHYQAKDVVKWFAGKGIELHTEEDGRMFPITDSSETIIECFMREALRQKFKIEVGNGVKEIERTDNLYAVRLSDGTEVRGKFVLVASGGNPNISAYQFIGKLEHTILPLKPSLFTFNDSGKKFADLMGLSVTEAEVRIEGTKLNSSGPVLITHWGLSGPAVIRLSAWAAEYLAERNYQFDVLVNWTGNMKEDNVRSYLSDYRSKHGKQKVVGSALFHLPSRLWTRLCELSEISAEKIWGELPMKNLNRLIESLTRCRFSIKGKTTFKEEFVTCGGVDLSEIDVETMESKINSGMFFAGEVLNIDGETGGFNFQSAWSTAFIAAKTIGGRLKKLKEV